MRRSIIFKSRSLWVYCSAVLAVTQCLLWRQHARLSHHLFGVSSDVNVPLSIRRTRAATSNSVRELKSISSRYYIYDDDTISQSRRILKFRRQKQDSVQVQFAHITTAIESEQNMLEALKRHPLRTRNSSEAEIFIVSTPITELLAYGCHWEYCTWYDEAFDALVKTPTFQQHQGRNHVIIAQSWPLFNKRFSAYVPALSRYYRWLENVTVASSFDPFGCIELHNQLPSRQSDFSSLFEEEVPVTNAFSVGLGFHRPYPIQPATFAKFKASEVLVFYRASQGDFSFGSTKFRDCMLNDTVTSGLPSSDIGFDSTSKDRFASIASSKFCLVVREDTPHSFSLATAVRAGCIPVIISDDYQMYGGPFKSSMSTTDFAIYIKESSFLADPLEELRKLQHLSDDVVKEMLSHLSIAQRILMLDHPQSLFVEALLREAVASRTNELPQVAGRFPIEIRENDVTISGQRFLYRYPSTMVTRGAAFEANGPIVIVGVLSAPENFDARHSIRETWASKHDRSVFFIVAGSWSSLEEEFAMFGDLFWVDMEEDYHSITYKVQAFLHAVDTHVDSYDYILKTDDDSYVFLDDVKLNLGDDRPDYWGCIMANTKPIRRKRNKWYVSRETWPHKYYPSYASGIGYALSRNFTSCAVGHLEDMKFMPNEDVATGILAESCGVRSSSHGWPDLETCFLNNHNFVTHRVKSSAAMIRQHWKALKNRNMGEWSTDRVVKATDLIYRDERAAPIVLESHKLVFFNAANARSTTWTKLFRRMMGYQDWDDESANGLKFLHHYSTKRATELMNSPEYTKAVFVRDPKDRILSAYLREPPNATLCCTTAECRSDIQTFPGFIYLINDCEECCRDVRWLPQSKRIDEKFHSKLDFVLRYETVQDDAKRLLEKIGAWDEYGQSGWGQFGNETFLERKEEEEEEMHAEDHYDLGLEWVVENMYAEDYLLFSLPRRHGVYSDID